MTRPTRRRILAGAAGVLAVGTALVGSRAAFRSTAASEGLQSRTRAGIAFRTPIALTVAGSDAAALDAALAAAVAALRTVERATSVYNDDGDLARLNRTGRLAAPSPHLVVQLRHALALSAETDGGFDPTVQPLWDVWAAHSARDARPDPATLRKTLERVDWRGVTVEADEIRFDRPGMAVTLNAINQGYAADVVMAVLAAHGVTDAFVDTGEFGACGRHPEGRGWRLGVAAPRDPETLAFTLDPFRRFAATSGDYETFFSPDFRDHHIFDPRTGTSPPEWSSITVEAATGLEADGLSTALFTMNAAEGRQLLERRRGSVARLFDKIGLEVGRTA